MKLYLLMISYSHFNLPMRIGLPKKRKKFTDENDPQEKNKVIIEIYGRAISTASHIEDNS